MFFSKRIVSLLIVTIALVSACINAPSSIGTPTNKAAYAMPDKYAAKVVEEVLAKGGNAVDASVAAAFSLAVTFPEAGNIGGGGFMLARMHGDDFFLDYREKAPLAADRDMYLDDEGAVIEGLSLIGIKAAGVPGTVKGMWEAHQRFGTLDWAELIAPAIRYAKDGFIVHPKKAKGIPDTIAWFDERVNFSQKFGRMQHTGVFKQVELANTLTRIAEHGPDDFYRGKTAELLVAHMDKYGGLISSQDLEQYQAVWREPLKTNWREYEVITAPPPSSGGFAVIQLLKMKSMLSEEFSGLEHNSPQYVHLVAEMEKRVFADRAEYFGDPDYVDIPIEELVSNQYIEQRAKEVQSDTISELSSARPGLESPNTTHFSIIDQWGNAVSNTYTLNWSYGSGVVVEKAGFILNNEMDDFSIKPGVKNAYGVVGGQANQIAPAKRMLSSMTPTILLRDDEVKMVVGTPGGSTIFTSVFQAIVNVIDFQLDAQQAVSASRFHHQLLPIDLITMSVSVPLSPQTIKVLRDFGYKIEPHPWEFGDLQLIENTTGEWRAASDPRGIGVAKVIPIVN